MTKIHINNNILDLALYPRVEITSICIKFHFSETSGDSFCYTKGIELADADFDTLSAFLLAEATNPHTNII